MTASGTSSRLALLLAAVILLLAPLVADAQESAPGAGLVVRDGEGHITYAWVPFEESDVSAMEFLRRSGLPVVTVSFGGLGEGVCEIGATGCDIDRCRASLCQSGSQDSPYWRFFILADGAWQAMPLGASSVRVVPGDLYAWSWTADAANLEPLSLADVRQRAGAAAGAGEVSRTTYDQAGAIVGTDHRSSNWNQLAYAGAFGVLGLMAIVAIGLGRRSLIDPGDDHP